MCRRAHEHFDAWRPLTHIHEIKRERDLSRITRNANVINQKKAEVIPIKLLPN